MHRWQLLCKFSVVLYQTAKKHAEDIFGQLLSLKLLFLKKNNFLPLLKYLLKSFNKHLCLLLLYLEMFLKT